MAAKKAKIGDYIISKGGARIVERNIIETHKEVSGDKNPGTYLRSDTETGKRSKRPNY